MTGKEREREEEKKKTYFLTWLLLCLYILSGYVESTRSDDVSFVCMNVFFCACFFP